MTDIFISYSRTDKTFVQRLYSALTECNLSIWVDWRDIPPTWDWTREIVTAIKAAEAFIFVISPDSVASVICRQELTKAVQCKKRLIPIVCREVDCKAVPESLATLNWVAFHTTEDFENAFKSLVEAINVKPPTLLEHFMESLFSIPPFSYFNHGIKFNERLRNYHAGLSLFFSVYVIAILATYVTTGWQVMTTDLLAPLAGLYAGIIGANSRSRRKLAVTSIWVSATSQIILIGLYLLQYFGPPSRHI